MRIPEAAGLAAGAAFLGACTTFQAVQFWRGRLGGGGDASAPHAALTACAAALLLGFVDDVLDVPWRVKLALPAVAALPLLVAYTGPTSVLLPRPLRASPALGAALTGLGFQMPAGSESGGGGGGNLIELGWLYRCYMLAVCVFCTNSINILAGVNGLEAGQALVLSLALCAHSLGRVVAAGDGAGPGAAASAAAHSLALSVSAPLAAASAALLCFNAHPSSVFVGDTFTLFAGMALAVAGVLGHCTETLLLLFAPQVFNFVYSLPQARFGGVGVCL